MPFKALLKEIVLQVEGAEGAILLDADGEAVQWYAKDDGERLRLRAAYIAVMVKACRDSASQLKFGSIDQMIIKYEGASFLIEELESGYFVVLELNPSANLGQALHRIKPAVANLRRAIAA